MSVCGQQASLASQLSQALSLKSESEKRERERERERERVWVCVCMFVRMRDRKKERRPAVLVAKAVSNPSSSHSRSEQAFALCGQQGSLASQLGQSAGQGQQVQRLTIALCLLLSSKVVKVVSIALIAC